MPPQARKTTTAKKATPGKTVTNKRPPVDWKPRPLDIKVDERNSYAVEGFFDSEAGVAYTAEMPAYASHKRIPGNEQFIEWLNAKNGGDSKRFTPIQVVAVRSESRTGMGKLYAEFLRGAPEVRIDMAIRHLASSQGFSIGYRSGAWKISGPSTGWGAVEFVKAVAKHARVSFGDARDAVYAFLEAEVGELAKRIEFPTRDAVRDEQYGEGNPNATGYYETLS